MSHFPIYSPSIAFSCQWSVRSSLFNNLAAIFLLAAQAVFVQQLAAESKDTKDAKVSSARPNILFIMADDHGYQAIGAYGSKVNQTPNIDRIANEGMRFDRCFVTNSICGPCRATILTGKYSHLNGFAQNGDRFNGKQQTVAKLLQTAGYQTAVIGKWHLGSDPTGFDDWHILQGQGPYYNPVMLTPQGKVEHIGYTTDIITDETLKWLKESRDPEKPFFLMYQHKAPHRNWQPSPRHLHNYDDVTIPEPETLFDDYQGRGTAAKTQKMTVANHLSEHDLKLSKQNGKFTEEQLRTWNEAYDPKNQEFREAKLQGKELIQWKYQRYAKDYLRCVDAVDENVGRVLDYLAETGLDQNTVVFYTSDQGWYLGEHGWYDKRWMYEESFRTPLLVRWPDNIKPGSVSDTMVMNLDFAETFLEIAGAKIPDDMQGRSMVDVLQGKTPEDWRKSVYYHYYEFPGPHSVRRHNGVRTDQYKLIHFYEIGEWELYDLQKDPHELNSVYDAPDYKEIQATLHTELERLQQQYRDEGTVVKFDKDGNEIKPKADKTKALFNGKDLTGWAPIKEHYFKQAGEVKVIDHEIQLAAGKPGTGIAVAGENAKQLQRMNYQIELDAKRVEGGDFFCGMTFPVNEDYCTLIMGGWGGTAVGLSNIDNAAAIENETTNFIDFEQDRWYHIRLRVTPENIKMWLDDELSISVDTKDKELSIWWEMEPARPLGICTWNTTARLKNIRVTKLNPEDLELESADRGQ
jgi:arylsulfatase A-like enzyme